MYVCIYTHFIVFEYCVITYAYRRFMYCIRVTNRQYNSYYVIIVIMHVIVFGFKINTIR